MTTWRAAGSRAFLVVALGVAFGVGAGCDSDGDAPSGALPAAVGELIGQRCGACHEAGGLSGIPLDDPAAVATWAPQILDAVKGGRMPPWPARSDASLPPEDTCEPPLPVVGDPSLSPPELGLLEQWWADGAEAPPSIAPAPPAEAVASVDLEVVTQGPFEVAPGSDRVECFVLDTGLTEPLWIAASAVVPGNLAIVHHVQVYAAPSGPWEALIGPEGHYECAASIGVIADTVGGWGPGSQPFRPPEGAAMRLDPAQRLIVQLHYHPSVEVSATSVDPGTRVQFERAPEPPEWESRFLVVGNVVETGPDGMGLQPGPGDPEGAGAVFRIPAGAADHPERMLVAAPQDLPPSRIWSVGHHMHVSGRTMSVRLHRQASAPARSLAHTEAACLHATPRWDFDWQLLYVFDAPTAQLPTVQAGDVFDVRCTYDNTWANEALVRLMADRDQQELLPIEYGDETRTEMCVSLVGVLLPR